MYPFLTKEISKKLDDNYRANQKRIHRGDIEIDFEPLLRLFTPDANCTWLLTELDPVTDIAFGWCDLGLGMGELGYVSFQELSEIRGRFGLPIERDLHFEAEHPLSWYVEKLKY
jgi:hypothetical protein